MTDSQVIDAVKSGLDSLDKIQAETELGTMCGTCLFRASRLVNETLENQQSERQADLHYEVG